MNKISKTLVAMLIALSVVGCEDNKSIGKVADKEPAQKHREQVWTEGCMTYELIEGHYYLIGHFRYNGAGVQTITHAESCPCKLKAN